MIFRVAPFHPESCYGSIIIHSYNSLPKSSSQKKTGKMELYFFPYNVFILFNFLFVYFLKKIDLF